MVDGNDPVKLTESHERPWLNIAREFPGVFPMKDFGSFLAGEVFDHLRRTVTLFDNDFKEKLALSIQPVFKPQAGDLGEVHGVAGEERGVMSQGNAGDSEIHGADADALAAEAREGCSVFGIQR